VARGRQNGRGIRVRPRVAGWASSYK
jgi:hypothetical protein